MIERLLAAESAFARDEVEVAGRLFAQVAEADPRNAMAVVGLARVANREGRRDEAKELAERALTIDPQEAAAARLLRELLLGDSRLAEAPIPRPVPNLAPASLPRVLDPGDPPVRASKTVSTESLSVGATARRRSLFDRIRGWLTRSGGRRT